MNWPRRLRSRIDHAMQSIVVKTMWHFIFFMCITFSAFSEEPKTQNPPDLTTIDLEKLMQIQYQVPTVFGASKMEQKSTEAPSSVTVITADEIKRFGYRTLAEILQSVQGFQVSYDRNYAFVGTRGVSLGDFNSRILLLIDGHRLNNNLTDGALVETAFILDVDLIERVEIIRGPGSVLYGNNAFFGVINVITRQAKSVDGAEVSGEYSSFDSGKGRVSIGKSFTNGFQFLLSGTLYENDGNDRLFYKEFDTPAQNHGVAKNMDADSSKSFFGSLAYRDFTLQGAFITREKVNPTAQFFTTFNDPDLRTVDERSYANLKYAHNFEDVVDVTAQIYYDRNDFDIGYPFTSSSFREIQVGEWWGTELQFNKKIFDRHVLTLGVEYRDDFHQSDRVFDEGTGQTFTDINRTRESHGVFLQGDFALCTNLHFNVGGRYDQYGDFDAAFNPRLALIYHPIPSATLKALYGTAFRAPNFLELSDPRFQEIRPEEITSYELVYEQEINPFLRSSLSGFYNQMDNLIVLEDGNFTNFNANAIGTELGLTGFWTNGIRTRLSYTLQKAEDRSRSENLPDSPEQLAKANVSVPLYEQKIFASLEFQYTTSRHTLRTTTTGNTLEGQNAPGFGVFNFTLFSRDLIKNLEFSASVYNLLDRQYGDPSSRFHQQDIIGRDGRTFRVKLTYRF